MIELMIVLLLLCFDARLHLRLCKMDTFYFVGPFTHNITNFHIFQPPDFAKLTCFHCLYLNCFPFIKEMKLFDLVYTRFEFASMLFSLHRNMLPHIQAS